MNLTVKLCLWHLNHFIFASGNLPCTLINILNKKKILRWKVSAGIIICCYVDIIYLWMWWHIISKSCLQRLFRYFTLLVEELLYTFLAVCLPIKCNHWKVKKYWLLNTLLEDDVFVLRSNYLGVGKGTWHLKIFQGSFKIKTEKKRNQKYWYLFEHTDRLKEIFRLFYIIAATLHITLLFRRE